MTERSDIHKSSIINSGFAGLDLSPANFPNSAFPLPNSITPGLFHRFGFGQPHLAFLIADALDFESEF